MSVRLGWALAAALVAVSGGAALAMPARREDDPPAPPVPPVKPRCTWIPARYKTAGNNRAIRRVVIHISDGNADAAATARYFASMDDGREASAHYVVGRAGEIFQCVADADIAWHCIGGNSDTIGIENSARTRGERGPGDDGLPVTEANYVATAALVRWLCWTYAIPMDRAHIVGHNELAANHADCPTGQWDWTYFMGRLLNG